MATQTQTQRKAAARRAAATRRRNTARRSQAAKRAAETRAQAELNAVQVVQAQAERALLIPVGAALTALFAAAAPFTAVPNMTSALTAAHSGVLVTDMSPSKPAFAGGCYTNVKPIRTYSRPRERRATITADRQSEVAVWHPPAEWAPRRPRPGTSCSTASSD
jgi:hypothetical protein